MTEREPLLIYGAGDHGMVVAEAASTRWTVAAFVDEYPKSTSIFGMPVMTSIEAAPDALSIIVAIGHNMARRRIFADLCGYGRRMVNVIHPTAVVSPSALLGLGIYIGPHAVVNAQASIENGAIVNSGAIVEHHSQVCAFAHVGPGAVLAGRVHVGPMSLIGAGASVRPGVSIGDCCTVGAGAAVVSDLPNGTTAVGVPARSLDAGARGDAAARSGGQPLADAVVVSPEQAASDL